jgi:hypothetical protein
MSNEVTEQMVQEFQVFYGEKLKEMSKKEAKAATYEKFPAIAELIADESSRRRHSQGIKDLETMHLASAAITAIATENHKLNPRQRQIAREDARAVDVLALWFRGNDYMKATMAEMVILTGFPQKEIETALTRQLPKLGITVSQNGGGWVVTGRTDPEKEKEIKSIESQIKKLERKLSRLKE